MNPLPDLERRLDRKLDKQRGLHLSYDDLALLVATGAYATFKQAANEYRESQCRKHIDQARSTSEETMPFTPGQGETSRSSGMTTGESGSDALARAQKTLRLVESPLTGTTSAKRGANTSRQSAGKAR